MTIASGLGSQFMLAKETVYGTVVTPNRAYEFDSSDLALDQTYMDGVGLKANRTFQPSGRMRATTRQAGGGSPMDVPTKLFGSILDLMHGNAITPVQQAATAAYLQTHNIGTSVPNKSATLQVNKPTSQGTDYAMTYPGSVLTGAGFAIDTGGILKFTPSWDSQDELTADTTPTGPALATPTYSAGVTSYLGINATVTMNSVAVAVAKSATINWSQPYATDRQFLGGTGKKSKPIVNGFTSVSGTLDLEWFDTSAYVLFRSGAIVSVVIDCINATIASTYKEEIKFTLNAVQIRGESPAIQGPDVLEQSVAFSAGDDGSTVPLVITYQSTDVTI